MTDHDDDAGHADEDATRMKPGRERDPGLAETPHPAEKSAIPSEGSRPRAATTWHSLDGCSHEQGSGPPSAGRAVSLPGSRFVTGEVLGEGGMGTDYLAEDQDLGRTVALKTLRFDDAELAARFVDEARLMGQLQHPGIVAVLDAGLTTDGRPWYSMPVVKGRTLAGVIARLAESERAALAEWSLTRLMQLFLQVCQAVGYAHGKGIVHRDLKPANVIVGKHGQVQVLDWGISKVLERRAPAAPSIAEAGASAVHDTVVARVSRSADATSHGLVMGTPAYMAPEQATAGEVDHRADVWALGVILYEMLTLRRPFDGTTTDRVLEQVEREQPPHPRQVAPEREVPQALERASLRALSKSAADRQQSVEELAGEVQLWLEAAADRARRRELADAKAAEGRELLEEYLRLKGEVAQLGEEAKERLKGFEAWRPASEKRGVYEAEDAARSARHDLTDAASRVVTTFSGALNLDADHRAAREGLAEYYWDRLADAEGRGEDEDVEFFAKLAASYDDGKLATQLAGDGSLSLESDPPDAEVWLHDFVEEDLVLQPRHAGLLGTTPLPRTPLAMGSYLVVLKKEGYRDTRYPVFISRNRDWEGTVRLFTDEEIGEGFVHVPAGAFIQGGDPECRGWDLPRSEPWVEDFFLAEHPVTNGEYLAYLNELVEREGLEAARARSPRQVAAEPETSHLVELDGRLELPEVDAEGDRWSGEYPVIGVSWHDAVSYCAWRTEREGREVRLPTESEWEKASRGVDGRWLPWGNRFDPSLCNMTESRREGEEVVVEVGTMEARFPGDVSCYGVRGMAGNVRDWTSTEGGGGRDTRVVRGGAWTGNSLVSRCAVRYLIEPPYVNGTFGFRVVRGPRRTRP